jgi:DNA repair protein RadA/Sms
LQVALKLKSLSTLYISGEESLNQIKIRADRLGVTSSNCYLVSETLLESVMVHLQNLKPQLVIIDSIQTLRTEYIESTAGSISQIRECTNALIKYAKETETPVFLIGHITKEGGLAGPKVLEHMVDVVLQFEGDHNYLYRLLRSNKNRFGSTSEIGIFEMQNTGLKEVLNPSELLLSHFDENLSGTAVAATIDGVRPFLIEVQALASSAVYGTPQRSSTGFDLRRLNMLLAVLEKRAGFKLGAKDVFLNIAGGLKVNDPSIDLAVVSAILSSSVDIPVEKTIAFAGEVGLSGEIRPVTRIDQRVAETQKLGFKKILVSKYNRKGLTLDRFDLEILFVSKIEEAFRHLFG